MQFFHRDSSSESSSSYESESDNDDNKIDPYWYEVTDDEDKDFERGKAQSSEEKLLTKLNNLCGNFDNNVSDNNDFAEALETFHILMSDFVLFFKKFSRIPSCVKEVIENSPDFKELLDQHTSAGEDDDDENDAEEGEEENRKKLVKGQLKALKELVLRFPELVATYEDKVRILEMRAQRAEEEERKQNEEEEILTEDGYFQKLKEMDVAREFVGPAERMANACRRQGYQSAYISALAVAADITITRSSDKPTIASINKALQLMTKSFTTLTANPEIKYGERLDKIDSTTVWIVGGYYTLLSKVYESVLHLAQSLDINGSSEIPFLENTVVEFADTLVGYYRNINKGHAVVVCAQILLDILSLRSKEAHAYLFDMMASTSTAIVEKSIGETIKKLAEVLSNGTSSKATEYKYRAICATAYQFALEGKYRQGRDLLFRSGVPAYVDANTDNRTFCIFFNRVVVQIAIGAFSAGDIPYCYTLLRQFWSAETEPAVLLGQANPKRDSIKDLKEEVILTLRDDFVPIHLQVYFPHLEFACVLSSLVVDTLNEAKNPYERKNWCKLFESATRYGNNVTNSNYSTPLQDAISIAYRAIRAGDYAKAAAAVNGLVAWRSFPGGPEVQARYMQLLKETALSVYCLKSPARYSTLTVDQLAVKFELEPKRVRAVINRLISEEDSLIAFWNADDTALYIDANNTTYYQHLVIGAADSISSLSSQSIQYASAPRY